MSSPESTPRNPHPAAVTLGASRTAAGEGRSKVLALPGSLRRDSYNRRLLEAAVDLAPTGMAIAIYPDLASIPLFNEDLERADGGLEAVRRLRTEVAAADALLIATPEYNQSIPGVLKNAIDWLSRPDPIEVLEGKVVSVIGASSGPWGTRLAQSALRQVLHATGAYVLPGPALFLRDAERMFDADGSLVDGPTRERLAAVLAGLAGWIRRVAAGSRADG
jgi:chromate reductase, NAD(P)H dehydrogenase (quinone)